MGVPNFVTNPQGMNFVSNANRNGIGSAFTTSIGQLRNDLSGVSASNSFNSIEAQKQRDWEERMSNTQYQRTVADMKAAGINPASLMSGASLTSLGSSSSATSSGYAGSGLNSILSSLTKVLLAAKGIKK